MTEPTHLDLETIAALADGRCSEEERRRAQAHLAECEQCYEIFADTIAVRADLEPRTGGRAPFRNPWAFLVAAAAVVSLVVLIRPFGLAFTDAQRLDRYVGQLASTARSERLAMGRLGPPFDWAPAPAALRSGTAVLPMSVERLEAVAGIRRAAENRRDEKSLNAVAAAALASGSLDEAIAAFTEAARVADASPISRSNLAAVLLERWRLSARATDAAEALNQAELALRASPANRPALFNRAHALEAMGMAAEAIAAWTAVKDAEPGSDWAREAEEHITRLRGRSAGLASNESRLWPVLVAWTDRQPAGTRGDADLSEALTLAARVRDARGDAFLPAIVDAADRSPTPAAKRCVSDLIRASGVSRARFDESRYPDSVIAAEEALQYASCAKLESAPFQVQVAWAMFFTEHRSKAAAMAEATLGPLSGRSYWRAEALARYMTGLTAQAHARMRLSLEHFDRAVEVARRASDIDLEATILTAAAETLTFAGAFEDAWTFHRRALAMLEHLSPRRRHIVLAGSTLTSLASGQHGAAVFFAGLQVGNAERWGNPSGRVSSHLRFAQALRDLGGTDEAVRALQQAEALLPDVAAARERSRYEGEIAFVRGQSIGALRSADPVGELTRAARAFAEIPMPLRVPEVLLARSRAQLNAGRNADARNDLVAGIEAFEDQTPSLRELQLAVTRRSALWELFQELIQLESDPASSLAIAERARGRALLDSLAREEQITLLAPPALYQWLPSDTTVVAYSALRDYLARWEVTAAGVRFVKVPVTLERLTALVSDSVERTRLGRTDLAKDRELTDGLLPPGISNRGRVVFLPDGPLHQFPFGTLRLSDSGQMLDQQIVVATGASLTLLEKTGKSIGSALPRALVVGYGEPAEGGLPALPEVRREVALVAREYKGHTRLEGLAATPAAVLQALPSADIIHFAGHAVADEVWPSESRLLVAPDAGRRGELRAEDIAGVRLRPGSVVVLSACSTARGRVYRGEGAMTLARPFLAAGASAVVATLWPVRDGSLIRVLTELHKNLAKGMDAPTALAHARRGAGPNAPVDERSLIVIGTGGAHGF